MQTTKDKATLPDNEQLKELLSKITQGEWRVDNGYKNGQILPNNCFYIRDNKNEMIATIYRKKDAQKIVELKSENERLKAINEELNEYVKYIDLKVQEGNYGITFGQWQRYEKSLKK